jgi:hypothetical protein
MFYLSSPLFLFNLSREEITQLRTAFGIFTLIILIFFLAFFLEFSIALFSEELPHIN